MLNRCTLPSTINYDNDGGRGIKVCERWHTFANFLADMGLKPTPKHTIDRYPDKDGDYTPTNCRWATRKEQAANRRAVDQVIDLTAQRFGRLIAVSPAGIKHGHATWLCHCDCGKRSIKTGTNLTKGITRSCGCLARELSSQRARTRKRVGSHFA